jgi:DNA-binding NtrC family response regulator
MKILVVDDEEIVLGSCQRVLSAEGFDVILSNSADSALEILKTENPELLLVDVKMPGRDGLSLVAELKEKSPGIAIIVMSGYPTPATISQAVKKGAACLIPKPFTPDELIGIIRQVILEKTKDVKNENSDH